MKYCPECGKELIVDTKFCSECGMDLTQTLQPVEPKAPEHEAKETTFVEVKRNNLIVLLLSVIYFLMAIPTLAIGDYEIGGLYCVTTSVIFLILFIIFMLSHIKTASTSMGVGMLFVITSMFIGFIWSLSGYIIDRYSELTYFLMDLLLYGWPLMLSLGFLFLIYSLIEPEKK